MAGSPDIGRRRGGPPSWQYFNSPVKQPIGFRWPKSVLPPGNRICPCAGRNGSLVRARAVVLLVLMGRRRSTTTPLASRCYAKGRRIGDSARGALHPPAATPERSSGAGGDPSARGWRQPGRRGPGDPPAGDRWRANGAPHPDPSDPPSGAATASAGVVSSSAGSRLPDRRSGHAAGSRKTERLETVGRSKDIVRIPESGCEKCCSQRI